MLRLNVLYRYIYHKENKMLREFPEYYQRFECIGGGCKDSCCIGWELDIDEETFEYYKSIEGEFGDRLRANMKSGEDNTFVLKADDRCPFLNEDNLCDIYINLGEESLCGICTEYPRYTEYAEDYMQSDMSFSCMEVGKLIFDREDPIRYLTYDDGQTRLSEELTYLLFMRNRIINLINDVHSPFSDYKPVSKHVITMSEYYGKHDYKAIEKYAETIISDDMKQTETASYSQFRALFERMIPYLDKLEVIGIDWKTCYRQTKNIVLASGNEQWEAFKQCINDEYYTDYSKIISYFLFRYSIRAYDDGEYMSKYYFALFACETIKALDFARFIQKNGAYSKEDRIDIVHLYSKEVEHSEENVQMILELCKKAL